MNISINLRPTHTCVTQFFIVFMIFHRSTLQFSILKISSIRAAIFEFAINIVRETVEQVTESVSLAIWIWKLIRRYEFVENRINITSFHEVFFESNHIDTVCVPQMGSTDHTSVHILYNSERLNYSWMVLVMVTSQ